MEIKLSKTGHEEIRSFRIIFLQENNFQFIHNKCYDYGWADCWLFTVDDEKAGYGSIWGSEKREDRDAIFEFYLTTPFRKMANLFFEELIQVSGAILIECQSNDHLLSSMLFEYAKDINAEAILFEDHFQTDLYIPEIIFRREPTDDPNPNNMGGYVLEQYGQKVASGGFMLNYNIPYADIYMEVNENFRHKGFGSLIVQELKKEIYLMGRVPSARCSIHNKISKGTLLKAGFKVCGAILKGSIK